MNLNIHRGLFKPFEPVVLQFDLRDGYYPVRLGMLEVASGHAFNTNDFSTKCEFHNVPRRDLKVSLELMFDYDGVRKNTCLLRAGSGCVYKWPLPGGARPVLAQFKRVRLGAGHAVELVALRPYELLGVV